MTMKKSMYLAHRWVGLVVGLQLLAWSVGGFVFSILDIESVRGSLDAARVSGAPIAIEDVAITPAQAIETAADAGWDVHDISSVELRRRMDVPIYVVSCGSTEQKIVVDARTGGLAQPITKIDAKRVALEDFRDEADVLTVELLDGEPPIEFRGGLMPVYRVTLDHLKQPHLYISPMTGEVLKRRNKLWRIFDFFWMLHVMDYRGRDNFNHWLLTGASALAILTSVSGLVLWSYRLPRRRSLSRA